MKKRQLFVWFAVIVLVIMFGIVINYYNKSAEALVIILGRRANANAFGGAYYREVNAHIKEAYSRNGYIRIVINDGNPRDIGRRFSSFVTDYDAFDKEREIEKFSAEVLDVVKDSTICAIVPENDLLQAIVVARRLFNELEDDSKHDKMWIRNRKIIIIDNGIVTIGALNFSSQNIDNVKLNSSIDNFDFSGSEEQIEEFASEIAGALEKSRSLPNLKDISVVFIGLGDVAKPQKELSTHIREKGLKILWKTILYKCGVPNNKIDIKDYQGSGIPNLGFPPVRPIEFLEKVWEISSEQVNFDFGRCDYKNPGEAEANLRRFADTVTRYISNKSDIKIYVVGLESKDDDREYTATLSECRARTVMETLTNFDVPRDKMEVFGLAVYLPEPWRENDRPNNVFDPEIGKRNRKVMLIPSDIRNEIFLQAVLTTRDKLYGKK